jgi:hypothetical protein
MRIIGGRYTWPSMSACCVAASLAATILALSTCGGTANKPLPHQSGATIGSAQFHFRLTYPDGWDCSWAGPSAPAACSSPAATPTASASDVIPLTVEITKSDTGVLPAMLSISVLSLSDPSIGASARALPTQKGLHKVTLSGLTAYADTAVQQPVPGTSVTDTHTDYYLVHRSYEYQLSTDSLSNDDSAAALSSMLSSFTITT